MKDQDGSNEPESPAPGPDEPERAEYFAGEKGRTVPRSAWWILGLALVVLLSFVVVRPSWFTKDADDTSLDVPPDRHFTKTLAGSGHADGVWLTDGSPSTSYLVTLPTDSGRDETRLHLTGTTQVADDSTVFLVVSMDGQQVYKDQLPAGNSTLDAFVGVPEQLASDGQVRVQVRAEGTRHDEICTPDHSAGMQIHLDPTSVVEAALTEPIHTVRDAVASWDRRITVALADVGDQWRTTAAQLGMALTREGHEVVYAEAPPASDPRNSILVGPADELAEKFGWASDEEGGAGVVVGSVDDTPVTGIVEPDGALLSTFLLEPTVATADSGGADPRAVTTAKPVGDQVSLEALGADMSVGQITETRRWRATYSLADLPGGRIPQSVRVEVALPASPDDLTWILNADLNGNLVGSQRLNPTAGVVTIALPPARQLLENTLTLTVERDRDLGGCNVRVTSYPIQLRGESALLLGDDPGAGFTALPRQLAAGFAVYIPDAGAADAIGQLNAVTPALTAFVPAHYDPEFRWNTQPAPGKPFILVGDSPEVSTPVQMRDGRIVAGPDAAMLNLSSFDNGTMVETATVAGGAPGLAIEYVGDIGNTPLPDFGRESAQVVTPQGSFVVADDGTIAPTTPVRRDPPR
ncbi:hypothetical protein EGT67_22030 [Prescottella agglutinans]|uniref:Cyclic di-GMP-binding protein n=1 Tax=Prescottella agglutinans TaxID=1644129 RepID=A0A438B8K2_9NOCA|nr:hypothetical protein [Prescottella agglutinans]RVW07242.1 hypothetical protein EGT67_22030 [Prescottella agglutinans]